MTSTSSIRSASLAKPRRSDRLALGFAWIVWAIMLVLALGFVFQFASNVPFWDDWNMIAFLTGQRPVNLEWLWSTHNGHRIPLPRLILVGLYTLSGYDFRSGMYVNVLLMGALSAALIWACRRVTGHAAWSDAFFPLILLSWGHVENFLWTWQLTLIIPIAMVGALLVLMTVQRGDGDAALIAGAIGTVLLPLCGMPGVVYVPTLALWLIARLLLRRRSSDQVGIGKDIIIGSLPVVAIAITALYFVNFKSGAAIDLAQVGWRAATLMTIQYLTGGFGPAAERFWPVSGAIVVLLIAISIAVLVAAMWRGDAPTRRRAFAILCLLGGALSLALGAGLGRSGLGFVVRYFILPAPAICAIYVAWRCCVRGTPSRVVTAILFAGGVIAVVFGVHPSVAYARDNHRYLSEFARDLRAGQPVSILLTRHAGGLCPCPFGKEPTWGNPVAQPPPPRSRFPVLECVSFHDWLGAEMLALKYSGVGDFAAMKEDRGFEEIPLSAGGREAEANPTFTFDADAPKLRGVRVESLGNPQNLTGGRPAAFQVFWKTSDGRRGRYIHYWHDQEPSETIWIDANVDEFTINEGNQPGVLKRFRLVLLRSKDL